MEIKELQQKSAVELQHLFLDHREKLHRLRFDLAAGKVKNVAQIRQTKKSIAQILTLLNSNGT